ncbi:MAG: hypothetical protein MZV63_15145 [Marinilabiliales bacterium]|nr:hypothetical protein [Marinilabiliales bacterium]
MSRCVQPVQRAAAAGTRGTGVPASEPGVRARAQRRGGLGHPLLSRRGGAT